jgi:hypothetical protein
MVCPVCIADRYTGRTVTMVHGGKKMVPLLQASDNNRPRASLEEPFGLSDPDQAVKSLGVFLDVEVSWVPRTAKDRVGGVTAGAQGFGCERSIKGRRKPERRPYAPWQA